MGEDRRSLWHICRHCDNCNGVSFEDDTGWYVSVDCELVDTDIIKDETFLECPIGKWKINDEVK